jgi:hypothetical protein
MRVPLFRACPIWHPTTFGPGPPRHILAVVATNYGISGRIDPVPRRGSVLESTSLVGTCTYIRFARPPPRLALAIWGYVPVDKMDPLLGASLVDYKGCDSCHALVARAPWRAGVIILVDQPRQAGMQIPCACFTLITAARQ